MPATLISFRIDPHTLKHLDKLPGTRTYHLQKALNLYLKSHSTNNKDSNTSLRGPESSGNTGNSAS